MSERETRVPGVVVVLVIALILGAVAFFIATNATGEP